MLAMELVLGSAVYGLVLASLYRFNLNAVVPVRRSWLFVPCQGGRFQIPRGGVRVGVGGLYRLRVCVRVGVGWNRLRVGIGVLVTCTVYLLIAVVSFACWSWSSCTVYMLHALVPFA